MKRLRRIRLAALGFLEPLGFMLVVYSVYRWQDLLGIGLAGLVLIGYGAIRGR